VGLTNASVITNDGRAVLSFDPNNPNRSATVTVDGTEYTQSSVDGLFYGSGGDIWSGETPGSGMTASAGSQLRTKMGDILNSNKVSNETIDEWGSKVNGANKQINTGSSAAGNDGDKGEAIQPAIPPRAEPVARKRYGNLKYPLTLDGIDYMTIRQFEYVPLSEIGRASGRERRADRRHKTSIGSVTLPIPSQLADTNAVNWNNSEMNDLQMGMMQAGSRIMNSGNIVGAIQAEVNDGLNALGNNTQAGKQAIQSFLLGGIPGVGGANAVLGRLNGQMLNPNLELIFNGPTLRQFQYSFRLTPRSDLESRMVKSIIRFFKQGMSVKETTTNLFLSSPNVFQPRFYNKQGKQHTFINVIKKCACTSFTVNYVPDNTYMTLPNSSMTAYDISMSFTELDPIVDMDYSELDGDNDNVIGF
jgi:hypothetical protein